MMAAATLPQTTPTANVGWPMTTGVEYNDAEAERVSNLIDETLRQEASQKKEMNKHEIRVLLLGQSESGKSTLHKQFQLLYTSHTLENERPSWRPAVFLNIIRAVRTLLEGLEAEAALPLDSPSDIGLTITQNISDEIEEMALDLQPLLQTESLLAFEFNGGFTGRASTFARSGWQALISSRRSSSYTKTVSTPGCLHVAEMLRAHSQVVQKLWRYPLVTSLLSRRKLRVEESAPYFLNDIMRLCHEDYNPTIEDILNVRIQTLGVVEHQFRVQQAGKEYTWLMYDVGGTRGQRPTWIPFFDNATAILFLAPISAFDQQLAEAAGANRLEDSLQLFTKICKSKLLERAGLILLLNKVDLLKKKLAAGQKVRKYIPSYGNRPNTYAEVSEYFRTHFIQIHRKHQRNHQKLFVHFTSMLDIKATQAVIADVGNTIVLKHITDTGLI